MDNKQHSFKKKEKKIRKWTEVLPRKKDRQTDSMENVKDPSKNAKEEQINERQADRQTDGRTN